MQENNEEEMMYLRAKDVIYKTSSDTEFKFGMLLSTTWNQEVIIDKFLKYVTDMQRFRFVDKGEDRYSFIKCNNFITWSVKVSDDEDVVVSFNEGTRYPILYRNEKGVTVLDDQFRNVDILYTSLAYKCFQQ